MPIINLYVVSFLLLSYMLTCLVYCFFFWYYIIIFFDSCLIEPVSDAFHVPAWYCINVSSLVQKLLYWFGNLPVRSTLVLTGLSLDFYSFP